MDNCIHKLKASRSFKERRCYEKQAKEHGRMVDDRKIDLIMFIFACVIAFLHVRASECCSFVCVCVYVIAFISVCVFICIYMCVCVF